MKPRNYQITALQSIWGGLQNQNNVLLSAPCAAGKTFMFSMIVKKLLKVKPGARVLILTDREILVRQTADKITEVCPELMLSIGLACTGVQAKSELDKPVTVASRQTLINRLDSFAAVNLLIIDECHLVAIPKKIKAPKITDKQSDALKTLMCLNHSFEKSDELKAAVKAAFRNLSKKYHPDHGGNAEKFRVIYEAYQELTENPPEMPKIKRDQFGTIIDILRKYNPKMRMLGVTATPYRLVDGYIYGDHNSNDCEPYWDSITHEITVSELEKAGFLAPLTGKTIDTAEIRNDLKNVEKTAGEYNLGQLSTLMSKGQHIGSVVSAWQKYASDKRKTVVFCVTIQHCIFVAEAFNKAGIKAVSIHSQLSDSESDENFDLLKNGSDTKVFCSVAMLTTGMDVIDIDCIIMARPTQSTALYKQILGRGQRIDLEKYPGKTDCLVLDLVGNNSVFGTDLDRLKVIYRKRTDGKGIPILKDCNECNAELHPAVRVCPVCGYKFPESEFQSVDSEAHLKNVQYGEITGEFNVLSMTPLLHTSKKNGNLLLKLQFELVEASNIIIPLRVNRFICFPDFYSGGAVKIGKKLWRELTNNSEAPESVHEAMNRTNELLTPEAAVVNISGAYPEIKKFIWEELPF